MPASSLPRRARRAEVLLAAAENLDITIVRWGTWQTISQVGKTMLSSNGQSHRAALQTVEDDHFMTKGEAEDGFPEPRIKDCYGQAEIIYLRKSRRCWEARCLKFLKV